MCPGRTAPSINGRVYYLENNIILRLFINILSRIPLVKIVADKFVSICNIR